MKQKIYGATLVISIRKDMDDDTIVALPQVIHMDIDADDVEGLLKKLEELPQVYQVCPMAF